MIDISCSAYYEFPGPLRVRSRSHCIGVALKLGHYSRESYSRPTTWTKNLAYRYNVTARLPLLFFGNGVN